MTTFKIIKNAAGDVICYGPNDNNYEPGIPDGCTLHIVDVLPPLGLTGAKAKQITLLEAAFTAAIQLPVDYMATTFQADVASQDVLAKSLVSGKVPTGFYWLDSANAKVAMTFVQAQDLAYAMLVHGMTAFAKLQDKKTAVRAATTVADVLAVTL
jgi:hypothetical protein